jgi:hypothetical protein
VNKYSNRVGAQQRPGRGPLLDPDLPECGCYRIVLRRGAPDSGIRIWLGHPIDPETGEEMLERPFNWQAELNGARVDLWNYWPGCAREPISREEYDRLATRNATMDEESPFYDARRPIDLFNAPPPRF